MVDLLEDYIDWLDANTGSEIWGRNGNVNLDADPVLSDLFQRYDCMLEDMAKIHLQNKPTASLGYSQVEIINVNLKLLVPLLFKLSYEINSVFIRSKLRLTDDEPAGVVLVLSRRCGKSTIIAHIAVTVSKWFGGVTFQVFARTEDQASIIVQLAANLMKGRAGKFQPNVRPSKNSLIITSRDGASSLHANPATEV